MPTKTNYKSPVTMPAQVFSTAGSVAGDALGSFRGDDPTKKGYQQNIAASGALKGAGTGASLGTMIMPGIGTAIGAGLGAIVGGVGGHLKGKKEKEAFEEEQEEIAIGQGVSKAKQQFMQNQAMYGAVESPISFLTKELKSTPFIPPKNMSALQYKGYSKMKEISGVNTLPS